MGTSEIMSPGETSDFGELGYSGVQCVMVLNSLKHFLECDNLKSFLLRDLL